MLSPKAKDMLVIAMCICVIVGSFALSFAAGKQHRECVARGECKPLTQKELDDARAFLFTLR